MVIELMLRMEEQIKHMISVPWSHDSEIAGFFPDAADV
ncbi:hypothetical protein KSS87_017926 [Heliosperma pusillum]|nr:hypothetical protein KSS87_017926 [Heliosperma pusillum]